MVTKLTDIINILLPSFFFLSVFTSRFPEETKRLKKKKFVNKYPLQGTKNCYAKPFSSLGFFNFMDFCKIVDLMRNKRHLTSEGLEEIRKIKSGMNTGRDYEKLDDPST